MTFVRFVVAVATIGLITAPLGAAFKKKAPLQPPPIVRVQSPYPTQKFGDWIVEDRGTYVGAYTNNESNTAFGVLCGKECVAYTTADVSCEVGHLYLALINVDSGSLSTEIKCAIVEGAYVYTILLSGDMISAIKGGGRIGLAMPLKDGRFEVVRYSLVGASQAAELAASIAQSRQKAADHGELRDFAL